MSVLRVGLIGAKIGRSRLATALETLCRLHGYTLDFTPIETDGRAAFDFSAEVDALRAAGWTGVTVTHPHKTLAAAYAGTALVPYARRLGASNTLVFGPALSGHNTDYLGFLAAWRAKMGDRVPGRVAMAGAGGVARAIAPALVALGAEDVAVWDANPVRAEALARDFDGVRAVTCASAAETARGAAGLVNATPLGMAGVPGSAFDPAQIGGQSWAFDAVYTPTDTEFLRCAAQRDLDVLTGFDLFQHMALGTFEAYTGVMPDPAESLPLLDALRPVEPA